MKSLSLTWPAEDVALLTLQRPEALNAITVDMSEELGAAIGNLGQDSACRAVILTGAGRAFSSGADLGRQGRPGAGVGGTGRNDPYPACVATILDADVPVIAAVNGTVVGTAMALTLAADVRVAAPAASFRVGAIKIGLTGGESGMSWLLPRHIGVARAMDLMVTGRVVDAQEALELGLVTALHSADKLLPAALAVAAAITERPRDEVAHIKRLVWSATPPTM